MKTEIVKLPSELNELSLKVPESKKNEVNKVLNDIFSGTADWENQVDLIEVKDINDIMSIQLADAARKNAKTARLRAEKIFDQKRSEVQLRMMDDKLEDSLWLKSKQIMQLQFKHIEEKAKFKSEFVKRHEAEQLQLRNDLRYQKVLKYIPDEEISSLEISQMSDNVFDAYLSGINKAYEDRIAAEKKAEEERLNNERLYKLEQKRKLFAAGYRDFWQESEYDFRDMCEEEFQAMILNWKKSKSDYDEQQKAQRKENEKLKKEAEERDRLAKIESEKREKAEQERKAKEEAERKEREEKEREERAEYEIKLKAEREAKEKIKREEKLKREKLEAELKAREEKERKANEEKAARLQADLNKGDAAKVKDLIADLEALKTKYSFKSAKNKKMYTDVNLLIDKVVNHIK